MRNPITFRGYSKIILLLALFAPAFSQVPVTPSVIPHITFVNGVGAPCAGCKLYSYAAGTTTPLATYVDATGTSTNTNPITLDAAGGANIWVGSNSYKFVLKDSLGATIWTVDMVNAGNLFPCGPAGTIQISNSAVNGLTCDSQITINTTNHTLSVGTLPGNYVTIGALSSPTSWTFDTTSPATALASLGGTSTTAGTAGQLAYYAADGTTLSGTSSIPAGITAITQAPSDNSTNPATTAYVATPGIINPTSLQIAAGTAMTDNQGNGAKIQHSTGSTTAGDAATFDANGNIIDAGSVTPRTCNSNGCYRIEADGTIEQWGVATGCGGGAACNVSVTFPIPFTTTTNLTIVDSEVGGGANNFIATVGAFTASGFDVQYAALVFNGGGGGALPGSQTANWYAVGH